MKRILVILISVAALVIGSVVYAADTSTPTLSDILKALTELKSDIAVLKADGFTKANASGQLAVAKSKDGLVILEVTSILAGPDATVVGVSITNNTKDRAVRFSSFMHTTISAGGEELKVLSLEGFDSSVLPQTSKRGVILATPLPKGTSNVVFRTRLFDEKNFADILEPELPIPVAK